jgi:hypothetical protein
MQKSERITDLKVRKSQDKLDDLELDVMAARQKVSAQLTSLLGGKYPSVPSDWTSMSPELGWPYHPCPTSPAGVCIYDATYDPEHRGCVFCGKPAWGRKEPTIGAGDCSD